MNIRITVCIFLAVIMSMPTYAQVGELEEVVVTAQRREQNLQQVPVSVTAFTGATLQQANINDAADYFALTPNVGFTEGFSTGSRGIGISMRGIGNVTTDETTFTNGIGVYLDGFSIAAVPTGVVNPQLQDLERIEVLRGPQGTYFGRNALGGALNLTTRKPTDQVEGKLILGGESYENAGDQIALTAIVNIPLTEKLGVRAVAYYEDSTGLVENVNPGGVDSGHQYFMGRINMQYDMTDKTSVSFLVMHADEKQGTDENVPSGVWDLDTVETFGVGFDGTTSFNTATGLPCTIGVDCPCRVAYFHR